MVVGRDEPRRDGVADYVCRLAAHLREHGVPVDNDTVDDVTVDIVAAGGRLRSAAAELGRLGPDLVHLQFAPAAYGFSPTPGLLPGLLRAPLVTTVHEYGWWSWPGWVPEVAWRGLERRRLWDREAGRLTLSAADVIVTTPGHAAALYARLGRTAGVVPIGPNIERLVTDPAATRARLGLPARAPVVAFFGFVHPVKGVRWLLRAVASLRAGPQPDLRLVLAGGFDSLALPGQQARSFQAEVRADIAALGLGSAVTVTGWLPAAEVSALLRAADVAALPFTAGLTTKSGSLLAVLDHDLPLVGTSGPGTEPELAAAALLGPVRESEVLARHLQQALTGGAPAGGRALADAHAWPRIAREHVRVYKAVLAASSPDRSGPGAPGRTDARRQGRQRP